MRKCVMYVPLFFFAVTLAQKAPAYWQHFFRNKICTYKDNPDKMQKKKSYAIYFSRYLHLSPLLKWGNGFIWIWPNVILVEML